jgi:predicted GIY-YIG superfamily endonuclease
MKRRTFRKLRQPAVEESEQRTPVARDHHNVYVIELDPAAAMSPRAQRLNPRRDPQKPCVYVGMTGLTVEQRFANHKAGVKASNVVRRYGRRLVPELFTHLNPMPYEAAMVMERELAQDLRAQGYTVFGGH